MKVIFKNLIPVVLSLILFSCNTDNNSITEHEDFLSKKIKGKDIDNIEANYQNSIFLEGKFKITKPSDNQLVIYTETKDTKHVFLFNEVNKSFTLDKNIEKLFYLKNGIVLNGDLFLGVEGNISDAMIKDLKKISNNNLKRNESFKVLIHKWFSKDDAEFKDISIEELISESAKLSVGGSGSSCDSGGVGSTSCSITSSTGTGCSVSCGSGYYACCVQTAIGPDDCHCEEIK